MFPKGSVCACTFHRIMSKVIAVAHSILKDIKSRKDASACTAVFKMWSAHQEKGNELKGRFRLRAGFVSCLFCAIYLHGTLIVCFSILFHDHIQTAQVRDVPK
ncbi:unnamed protein product [Musa acuminata var. zebrina]